MDIEPVAVMMCAGVVAFVVVALAILLLATRKPKG